MNISTSKNTLAILKGDRVTLRPWKQRDVPFFMALRNDIPTQTALMARPKPNTTQQVIQWLMRHSDDDNIRFFVIASHDHDAACGFIELRDINTIDRWANLGICLTPSVRGQGLGREALAILEIYAKTEINLRKIVLHVISSNHTAIGLYEKTGYKTVGVHSDHHYANDQYHDVTIMEKILT